MLPGVLACFGPVGCGGMPLVRYLALLRGINVGGRNIISMADLREAFEAGGYHDVSTYIQSGNVLFSSDARRASLEVELETLLEGRLDLDLTVMVRSQIQMRNVVRNAPDGFGDRADVYHFDVVFLKSPLTSSRALGAVELREGVDRVWPGTNVLYFSRLKERRAQSKLSRLATTPEYRLMTIRNWNTTTRLQEMLHGGR